jgi:hypothetical protein
VLLEAVVTEPTTNPALVSEVPAAACVNPTTLGTAAVACFTTNPPTKLATSDPLATVIVRAPTPAFAAIVNCTLRLVPLATVGTPTLIPAPALTWFKPLRKLL